MKRLSVIVPIYNVEKYVEKCLLSIEKQDIPTNNYEIICINDGSTDNSLNIVELMQKKFTNIVLIDQENMGVSVARNMGIEKASGKYIMFIDPDDYIDTNSFARILANADEKSAQVSFLGFTVLYNDGKILYRAIYDNLKSQLYVGTEAYYLGRGERRKDPDRIYAVLLETEFINRNRLRFLPGVPYLEDGELITRILSLAERCVFDGHSFYQRTTRPGSATNSRLFYSEKSTRGFIQAAINLKRFQQEKYLTEKQREFLNQPILKYTVLVINSTLGWKFYSRIKSVKIILLENGLNKCQLKGCDKFYIIYGHLYNFSPVILLLLLFLRPRIKRFSKNLFRKYFV